MNANNCPPEKYLFFLYFLKIYPNLKVPLIFIYLSSLNVSILGNQMLENNLEYLHSVSYVVFVILLVIEETDGI